MRGRTKLFILVLVLLTVGVLVYALFGRGAVVETPPVLLPTEPPAGATSTPGAAGAPGAEVTPETVQAALATLSRPDSYSRGVTVEDYWDGGAATTALETYVSGGQTRIRIPAEGKSILVSGGEVYIWYEGEDGVFRGGAARDEADRWMRCVTYEALLALPAEEISGAGYGEYAGEPCIWAEYVTPALGYRSVVYVAVATGLLAAAESYDGETLVYRMYAGAADLSVPDAALFTPPAS